MTTTELLARVKATRAQKGRMYDAELQALLADVAAHLEDERNAQPTEAEIRAAPDLLAALKRLLASPMVLGGSREAGDAYADCNRAINKAEGR